MSPRRLREIHAFYHDALSDLDRCRRSLSLGAKQRRNLLTWSLS